MSDVAGKFFIGQIRRSGTSGSSPGFLIGEADPPDPVNPPGSVPGGGEIGAGAGLSIDQNQDIRLGEHDSDNTVQVIDINDYYDLYNEEAKLEIKGEAVETDIPEVNFGTNLLNGDYGAYLFQRVENVNPFFSAQSVLGAYNLNGSIEILINIDSNANTFAKVIDDVNNKGLENDNDYEANFTARSLVTKQYVDSNFPEWSERENNTVLFDKNYIIGNAAARTGNILFDFTGAKLGAETEMRHADASAFTFPAEAMLMFDTADISTTEDNYFLFVLTDKTASSEVVKVFHALEGGL